MEYFRDVYLKKLNRFGTTRQERILNQKEYDFHYFVESSPNRVTVFMQDYKFEGVMQTKTYNEIETIDYFLTYKSITIPTGSILKVESINHSGYYTYWIVIAKDNFVSSGYYRYTVVKLDREIRWITDEGYLFKALVHISGAGANALGKRIISSVKISDTIVYNPNQNLTLTMQDNKEIKRGTRVNIKGQVWKISGFDNLTNDGVSYVTLEQDYTDEIMDDTIHLPENKEPPYEDGIADGKNLERWTFNSNLEEDIEQIDDMNYPVITLKKNEQTPIEFSAFYYEKETKSPIAVEVITKDTITYNKVNRVITASDEGKIMVRLVDSPDIEQTFIVKVKDEPVSDFSVECAGRLKYGIPIYLTSDEPFVLETAFSRDRDKKTKEIVDTDSMQYIKIIYFEENQQGKYVAEMTVSQIIKNLVLNFAAKDEYGEKTGDTCEKIVAVESPWIGGR